MIFPWPSRFGRLTEFMTTTKHFSSLDRPWFITTKFLEKSPPTSICGLSLRLKIDVLSSMVCTTSAFSEKGSKCRLFFTVKSWRCKERGKKEFFFFSFGIEMEFRPWGTLRDWLQGLGIGPQRTWIPLGPGGSEWRDPPPRTLFSILQTSHVTCLSFPPYYKCPLQIWKKKHNNNRPFVFFVEVKSLSKRRVHISMIWYEVSSLIPITSLVLAENWYTSILLKASESARLVFARS